MAGNTTVTAQEDTAYVFTAGDFGFSDADAGDTLTAIKIASVPGKGELFFDGTAPVSAGGTISLADINSGRLSWLQSTPNETGTGYTSFTYNVTDNSGSANATSTTPGTLTINVTGTNDDPTMSGIPASLSVTEDLASPIDLSAVTFADVDSASGSVSLRLSVDAGMLAATTGGGVTVSGTGTNSLTLSGTVSAIDSYLNTASNIQYTTALNAEGSATLSLVANDGGNSGIGGGTDVALGNVTLNITPVNDAPILDLDGAGGNANHATDFGAGGTPVLVTDSDATLVELDTGDILASLTAVLAATPNGANEVLGLDTAAAAAAGGAGLTVNYSSATRTLTISGAAGVSVYQSILRGITYGNSTDPLLIDGSDRTVSITVNDGDTDSNVPTSTISIVSAPLVDWAGDGGTDRSGTAAFTEQTPLLVAPSATVTEADGDNLDQMVVTLTNSQGDTGEQIVINGQSSSSVVNGITITYDSANRITLSGAATAVDYQGVLRGLQYHNTSDSPDSTARTITAQGRDVNGLFGNTATLTVSITQVNDAPLVDLDGAGGNANFSTEFGSGGNPVLVADADATVVELDAGDQLESLRAVLTATPDGASESLGLDAAATSVAAGAGLGVSYDSGTRTLTVTGTANTSVYQDIVRGITYGNSKHPVEIDGSNREVTITVNDGELDSNAAISTIDIVNAPLIDWTGDGGTDSSGTASFTEQTPLLVAPSATVIEADGDNLDQMVVTLTNSRGDTGEQIVIDGQSSGSVVNGITITYDSATQITLSGSATAADYQALLRTLQYLNNSDHPDTTARVISVQGRDVNGLYGNTPDLTVSITRVNDAPVLDLDGAGGNADHSTEFTAGGNPISVADTDATLVDVDTDDILASLTAVLSATPDGANEALGLNASASAAAGGAGLGVNYDSNARTLTVSGAASASVYQDILRGIVYSNSTHPVLVDGSNRQVTITVNDGELDSNTPVSTIDVVNAPLIDWAGDGGTDNSGTASFTEQTPLLVAPSATVVEKDGDNLKLMSINLTGYQADTGERIVIKDQADGSVMNGITITYSTPDSLLLSGVATAADYQAVLRNLEYHNDSDDPNTTPRVIYAQGLDDNNLAGNGPALTVSITTVNDEPTLSVTADNPNFVEGTPITVFSNADARVIEAGQMLTDLKLTVTNIEVGTDETLTVDGTDVQLAHLESGTTATNGLSYSVSITGTTATLSFGGGSLTDAEMNALIDGITYRHNSDDPTATGASTRDITVTYLKDDGGTADGGDDTNDALSHTSTVTIVPVNDAPVMTAGAVTDYTENDPAQAIDNTITISDIDDTQIDGATVAISAGLTTGDVLGFSDTGSITGSYHAGSGTLTLTGRATLADYQTALRTVTFHSTSEKPTETSTGRTITWTVTDANSDGAGAATSNGVTSTINITPLPDAPIITSNSGGDFDLIDINEHTTAVTDVDAVDPDGGSVTYAISGPDAHLFTIDAATGVLAFDISPNYEAPADVEGDNVYQVTVTATDSDGLTDTQALAVRVNDVTGPGDPNTGNRAPTITSGNSFSIDENLTAIGSVTATDADGHGIVYAISGGADASKFEIDTATGVLSFKVGPDYENPTDLGDTAGDNTYVVQVTASDDYGTPLSATQTITVTVNDVNVGSGPSGNTEPNNDPTITSNGGGDTAAVSVVENTTAVTTVTATDPDADNTGFTYRLSGGTDQNKFSIDANTGALRFNVDPNFEIPADADGDNIYQVQVTVADDHGGTDTQTLSVSVTDVTGPGDPNTGNRAPTITSGNAFSIDENLTAVGSVTATDADGHGIVYAISGGADASKFEIDSTTGALSFKVAPDYENPTDLGDTAGNNTYVVQVTASDDYGTPLSTTQTITVTVNDVAVGSGPSGNIEPNNDPTITSNGGGDTAAVSVAEHTTAVTTVTATDPDADNTGFTYNLSGGADQNKFSIDAGTGELTFKVAPNYEAPADADGDNVYQVQVTVTDDDGGTDTQTLSVSVTDVTGPGDTTPANRVPVFSSGTTVSVPENTMPVMTVAASDPDGQDVSYTIVGGADAALFSIDAVTGALSFVTAPDFETPADADSDNDYEITVSATDSSGGSEHQSIVVTVTDVAVGAGPVGHPEPNNAPVITSNGGGDTATASVVENTTAVTTVTATDPDADNTGFTYNLSGGADQSRFAIDANTGALTFKVAPNFEAPADADGDNVYQVQVTVTDDDGGTDTQTLSVNVTDVTGPGDTTPANRVPVFSSGTTVSVPENTMPVMTVAASDPDGQDVSYAITGGADAAQFAIDAATGALAFVTAPDFEAPADADSDNAYEVTVSATDTGGGSQSQSIVVTVTDVAVGAGPVGHPEANNDPTITSDGGGDTAAVSVIENTTAVTTVTASDKDADNTTLTYSLSGGADRSKFSIDAGTGELTFKVAPNYEAPADADGDNVYQVQVTVTDDDGGTDTQTLSVSVTDVTGPGDTTPVNRAPVITSNGGGATATIDLLENKTAVTTVQASEPDGQSVVYSIVGGSDAGKFNIDATTGALRFKVAPNFEAPSDSDGNNSFEVVVQASDTQTPTAASDIQTITVNIQNDPTVGDPITVNRNPVITGSSSISVVENTLLATTVTATDPDGQDVGYAIVGGADQSKFTIDATTGALNFKVAPNYEAPADSDLNNRYEVTVRATDTSGGSDTRTLDITVTDDPNPGTDPYGSNRLPVITSGETFSVAENTTAVGTVTATDPDGQDITFAISGGTDAAKFAIDPASGALTFKVAPNYEAPADVDGDNVYALTVQVRDASGGTATKSISVTVTDVTGPGDPDIGNRAPTITSSNSFSIDENLTAVGSVTATDADGHGIVYAISGGADADKFQIDSATGALSFKVGPDYENPTDLGDTAGNNTYVVQVTASDDYGTPLSATQTVTVTVNDVAVGSGPSGNAEPNNDPTITSDGGGDTAAVSVIEHTTTVTTVTATDKDADNTGFTYSLSGGADQSKFSIDAGTGELSFKVAPNYEAPADADADNIYDVQIMVTDDDGGTDTQTLTVTVTDVTVGDPSTANDAPAITSGSTFSIDENLTAVGSVTATDADGHGIVYAISGGADASKFEIDSTTGALSFKIAPNYENPTDLGDTAGNNTYVVQVTASDDYSIPLSTTQTITVTVNDVAVGSGPSGNTEPNNNPTITSNGGGDTAAVSVAEHTTAVTTVTATDKDADNTGFTYSLSGGTDQSRFSIDAGTGALAFKVGPDYEAPADADRDNVYQVQVTVTDDDGGTDTQTLSVTVTDVTAGDPSTVNDAPVFTNSANVSVPENNLGATTLTATDADGHALTYRIVGGADAAGFTLDPVTGVLNFKTAPNFEAPADDNGDGIYTLTVQADDGNGGVTTQNLSITVTNVTGPGDPSPDNRAPVFSSAADRTVNENSVDAGYVVASDPDGQRVRYAISGGADAALFTLDTTSGALAFVSAPDFEKPHDADKDNVYELVVTATDTGGKSSTQILRVNVSDAGEFVPRPPFEPTPETPETTPRGSGDGPPREGPGGNDTPEGGGTRFLLGDHSDARGTEFRYLTGGSALNSLSSLGFADIGLDALQPPLAEVEALYTKLGDNAFRILVTEADQPALFVFQGMEDVIVDSDAASFRIDIPTDAFTHTDRNAIVVLKASLSDGRALPEWLHFDAVRGVFTGVLPDGVVIDIEVMLTAVDMEGREAGFTFTISAADLPQKPGFSEQLRKHSAVAVQR